MKTYIFNITNWKHCMEPTIENSPLFYKDRFWIFDKEKSLEWTDYDELISVK